MKIVICRGKRCCPTVETTNDGFVIKDDYGGEVKFTKEEMKVFKEKMFKHG